ncbi:MAG: AAA family ATPase [Roseburia sp.]|nr:AAA family ATPase [Roseburia sp.]
MKIELTVSFNGSWVLEHRNDEKLPVYNVAEAIGKDCRMLKITHSTFVYAEMALDTDLDTENLPDTVRKKLSDVYGEEIGIETVTVMCRKLSDDEYSALLAGDREDAESESAGESAAVSADDDEDEVQAESQPRPFRFGSIGNDVGASVEKPSHGESEGADVKKLLDEIYRLPGSREFKAMCYELADIAPIIKRNNTSDAFLSRSYVFFVNDGCGYDNDLELFAKLISATGVVKMATSRKVAECTLGTVKDSEEPFENAMRTLRMSELSAAVQLLSIDISEWINATDNRYFKVFLKALAKQTAYIPVFRVPYVDKYVQNKLVKSLGDVLFIHSVAIPPYTHAELEEYARRTFAHYGYTLDKAAWTAFFARLDDERADGKFYGLDTVRKVVMELLYAKQVYDAKRDKNKKRQTSDKKLINGRAAAPIVANIDTSDYGIAALKRLVGSENIEKRVNEIVAQIELAVKSGKERPCIHMQFVGNPGTGKTTVARIVGKILKEKGILSVGNFFEHAGRDFCGRYIGETAPKTSGMCRDAYGSVLFIDEAYSLFRGDGNDRDFGREALDTLIAEMENHRSDFVVIMAGYTEDMKKMMTGNSGLASRVPYTIEFPNFTRPQLHDIFVSLASRFTCEPAVLDAARKYFDNIPDSVLESKEFSNARFVRNLFERTWAKASMRCQLNGETTVALVLDDFERAASDSEFKFDENKQGRIGFRI